MNKAKAMAKGIFYGIGMGPGDPELLTLKAVRVLRQCPHIYVPHSRLSKQDYVATVVEQYAAESCSVMPVTFSLAKTAQQRQQHWQQLAGTIVQQLATGEDVAFTTLGDPLLYSTYIYLIRELQQQQPQTQIVTIPAISAFSLCAALTNTPLGEGLQPLTVIPAANDIEQITQLVAKGGTVVLMKIAGNLQKIILALDEIQALKRSIFVSRAGLADQRIELDLNVLRDAPDDTGNLAVIIVQGDGAR